MYSTAPQPTQPQDPTLKIVSAQPQLEQPQELTPEVTLPQNPTGIELAGSEPATTFLSIDELANWLAGPGEKSKPAVPQRKSQQPDSKWNNFMENLPDPIASPHAKVASKSTNEWIKSMLDKIAKLKRKKIEPEDDPEAGPGPATQIHQEGSRFQFVKRDHDPACQHKSLKHKTVWKAENPKIDYHYNLPYLPQLFAEIRPEITEILERELNKGGKSNQL
jgi:hypothetical protein